MRRLLLLLSMIATLFSGAALASDQVQRPVDTQRVQVSALFGPIGARPLQSEIPQVQKVFCGQCTDHEHCGVGFRCCRSNCAAGKKTCLKVSTC